MEDREDLAAEAGAGEVLAEELHGAGILGEQRGLRRRGGKRYRGGGSMLQFVEGPVPARPRPAREIGAGGGKEIPLTPTRE
jgi:hypothetical protein